MRAYAGYIGPLMAVVALLPLRQKDHGDFDGLFHAMQMGLLMLVSAGCSLAFLCYYAAKRKTFFDFETTRQSRIARTGLVLTLLTFVPQCGFLLLGLLRAATG